MVFHTPPGTLEMLAEHSTLTLATSWRDRPWASQVFFAEEVVDEELSLHFATLKPSRKWRHMTANPVAAFAVGQEGPRKWLQGRGRVLPSSGEDRIVTLLKGKSPDFELFVGSVEAQFFRLVVDEIRLVDLTSAKPRTSWIRR